jgi:hypothetical protein
VSTSTALVLDDADINPVRPENSALLGWPPMLPFELAMRAQPASVICAAYGIERDEFVALIDNSVFKKAYQDAVEGLATEGMSFRIKARMQAEELLKESWKLIHAEFTPNAVKADLIKATVRWAGYEPKNGEQGGGPGNAFQININLGA